MIRPKETRAPGRSHREPSGPKRRFPAWSAFPVFALLMALAAVWLSACMEEVAGKGGGTETEVAGRIIYPGGNATVEARVILRPSDYLADPVSTEDQSKRRQETVTDARGNYVLKGVPVGDYRIEIAGSESGGAIRDFSITKDSMDLRLPVDTLKTRGSILGSFAPDSEAQLASFVQVFGMERLVRPTMPAASSSTIFRKANTTSVAAACSRSAGMRCAAASG